MTSLKTTINKSSILAIGALFLILGIPPAFADTSDDSNFMQSLPLFSPGLPASIDALLRADDRVSPEYQRLPSALKESVASLDESKSASIAKKITAKKPSARTYVLRNKLVVATAYSSTPDQTDGDPCTTANGFNVCKNNIENVIAANFLPFGTHVKLPDLYGDRIFVVQDRMNARYKDGRIDVWMKTRAAAKQFGVKRSMLEIVDGQLAMK